MLLSLRNSATCWPCPPPVKARLAQEHGACSLSVQGPPLCPRSALAVLRVLSISHWTVGAGPRRGQQSTWPAGPWDPPSHKGQVWLCTQHGRIIYSCCCACCLLTHEPARLLRATGMAVEMVAETDGASRVKAPASLPAPNSPTMHPANPPQAVPAPTYQLRVPNENTAITSFRGDGPPRQLAQPSRGLETGGSCRTCRATLQPAATAACAQDPPAPGALSQGRCLCSNASQCR